MINVAGPLRSFSDLRRPRVLIMRCAWRVEAERPMTWRGSAGLAGSATFVQRIGLIASSVERSTACVQPRCVRTLRQSSPQVPVGSEDQRLRPAPVTSKIKACGRLVVWRDVRCPRMLINRWLAAASGEVVVAVVPWWGPPRPGLPG